RGVHVTCVDISSGMLDRLRHRLDRAGMTAEILCQNAFEHDRLGFYDVCATNYFLNVFPEREMVKMLTHAASLVRPGGKLTIADVALPQGTWPARFFNIVYLKSAMATFWMMGLVPWHGNYDYASYFPQAGVTLDHIRFFRLFKSGPVLFQTLVAKRPAGGRQAV
ncbi:MAG TPA: class I SAM-dependent methyltransferase, partial [Pirellulaceae bacterium]|nr:class I SAM-dependent methyltransferase [Pirellulaceae bacterium]